MSGRSSFFYCPKICENVTYQGVVLASREMWCISSSEITLSNSHNAIKLCTFRFVVNISVKLSTSVLSC